MGEKVSAVFFDFDGVLADTEELHFVLFQKVLAGLGLELTRTGYFKDYLGYDDRECFETFLRANGDRPTRQEIEMLIELKAALFQKALRDSSAKTLLFPGAREVVEKLALTYPLCVVSGALRPEIEGILKQESLLTAFKLIIAAEECTHNKPHPEPYEKALKALNPTLERPLQPEEILVVEDSLFGIESGLAAGMQVVGVAGTYPAQALQRAPRVIGSIRELLQILP